MRFVAPAREVVDPAVFERFPLDALDARWLRGPWPALAALDAALGDPTLRFVAQDEALRDGLHYETRIARDGRIATREANWHDLFNALVWIRHPALKRAMNARQAADVARHGRQRTRAQCALTHLDEAGAIVRLTDPALIAAWDSHDWRALFVRHRDAWHEGRAEVAVVGHALLEHALVPGLPLVAKALVVLGAASLDDAVARATEAIASGAAANDPQEWRPLPLDALPQRCPPERLPAQIERESFRPLRAGRVYPAPLVAH